MTGTMLRTADPAADLQPDPASPGAQALLARILAEPHVIAPRRRPARLTLVSGGLVAAAAVVGVTVASSGGDHASVGQAGFVVTRHADGSVRATIRWSELSDPAALQRALDAAGARTRVFVETGTAPCQVGTGVPYSADAVDWDGPDADPENALVVHPDNFPTDGTFVVVVWLAAPGQTGTSTFAPGSPQLTGMDSYLAIGAVTRPAC